MIVSLTEQLIIDYSFLINLVAIITALGVICSMLWKLHKLFNRFEKIEEDNKDLRNEMKEVKEEQWMQTKVLYAMLDGLHQLGCNGKTTEASQELQNFINKKAHE